MEEKILHLNYNPDFTSLSVGTDAGYAFHAIENLEKTHQIFVSNGIRLVERILSSNMAVILAVSAPRKLQVMNIDTLKEVCYFFFSSSIIAVRVNKVRMIVFVEEQIFIHEIPTLKVIHLVNNIPANPNGIGDICADPDKSYLAFPVSDSSGLIEVFDCNRLREKFRIAAHTSPVVAIVFNKDGNMLATASEKGTLIRIFDTCRGARLYEFRRGMLRNASIYSMVFSQDNNYFAVSSNTETVHIFKLPVKSEDDPQPQVVRKESTLADQSSWFFDRVKSYLPTQITEIFSEERAFASFSSPFQGTKKSCLAFNTTMDDYGKPNIRILLASFDGTIYIYVLNPEGGECPLLKQHSFVGTPVAPSKLKKLDSNENSYTPPSTTTLTDSVTSYLPSVNQIQTFSYNLLQSTMNVFDKSEYDQKTDTGSGESERSKSRGETEAGSSSSSVGVVSSDINNPPFIFGDV